MDMSMSPGSSKALARSTGLQRLRGSVGEIDGAEAGEASSAPGKSCGDSWRVLSGLTLRITVRRLQVAALPAARRPTSENESGPSSPLVLSLPLCR